jgi:hypothetical protein
VWSKWGGGKLLNNGDVNTILDLVVQWQNLTQKVLSDVLFHAVPGLNTAAIPYLQNPGPRAPMELIQEAIGRHITSWSKDPIDRIVGLEGCTHIGINHCGDRRVKSGIRNVDVLIGNEISGELVFSIPANLYTQLDELNRKLTVEPLHSGTCVVVSSQ